jgi:prepilin-type N-terminal cleavage/methylation domain-containing protein
MNAREKKDRGFTLIELLIVVAVIGILATLAIPKFASVRERSYMATVILDLKNLASQQEIYHGDHMVYATNVVAITEMVVSSGVTISVNEADGRGWAATAVHDAVPNRQCGIFYGAASASNASPATSAGNITCQN